VPSAGGSAPPSHDDGVRSQQWSGPVVGMYAGHRVAARLLRLREDFFGHVLFSSFLISSLHWAALRRPGVADSCYRYRPAPVSLTGR